MQSTVYVPSYQVLVLIKESHGGTSTSTSFPLLISCCCCWWWWWWSWWCMPAVCWLPVCFYADSAVEFYIAVSRLSSGQGSIWRRRRRSLGERSTAFDTSSTRQRLLWNSALSKSVPCTCCTGDKNVKMPKRTMETRQKERWEDRKTETNTKVRKSSG